MPQEGQKNVSVDEDQWKLVKHLVEKWPQIVGLNISEFYRVAAAERIERFIKLLDFKPAPVLTPEGVRPPLRRGPRPNPGVDSE